MSSISEAAPRFAYGLAIPDEERLKEENWLRGVDLHFGAARVHLSRLPGAPPPELPRNLSGTWPVEAGGLLAGREPVLIYIGPEPHGVAHNLWLLAVALPRQWPRKGPPYALVAAPWDDLAASAERWLPPLSAHRACAAVWVANVMAPHPKLRIRPLGLPDYFDEALLDADTFAPQTQQQKGAGESQGTLLLGAHSVISNIRERRTLMDLCQQWSFCTWRCSALGECHSLHRVSSGGAADVDIRSDSKVEASRFYEELTRSHFVMAPAGAMWGSSRSPFQQSFRLWEAMYFDVVPVVLEATDAESLLSGLPVLQVNRWSQLSAQLLRDASVKMRTAIFASTKRTRCLTAARLTAVSTNASAAARLAAAGRWLRLPPGTCGLWTSWWLARMRQEATPLAGPGPLGCRSRASSLRLQRFSGAIRPSVALLGAFLGCRREASSAFLVLPPRGPAGPSGVCVPDDCAETTGLLAILGRNVTSAQHARAAVRATCWDSNLGPELCCRREDGSWEGVAGFCFAYNPLISNCCDENSRALVEMLRDGWCREPWAESELQAWKLSASVRLGILSGELRDGFAQATGAVADSLGR